MLKRFLFGLFSVFLICQAGFGIPKNYAELLADPAFSNKDPEQQLELISKKLVSKEWSYEDLNDTLVQRVYFELFKGEKEYAKKIERYAGIKKKYDGLPQMIKIDLFLMICRFASTPEAQKGDFFGMMKVLASHTQDERLYGHALANLQRGLLGLYLASHPEFPKMDHKGKLVFLQKLVKDNIVQDLLASDIAVQIAMEWLLETPADKRKERIKEIEEISDTFTSMALGDQEFDQRLERFGKTRINPTTLPEEFKGQFQDDIYHPLIYFSTLPEFKNGNIADMMKAVRKASSGNRLGYPSEANFQLPLFAAFMASDADFQKADPKGKLSIVKKLIDDEVISPLVTNEYTSKFVKELLVNLPPDQQDKLVEDLFPVMDTFTKSDVEQFLKNSRLPPSIKETPAQATNPDNAKTEEPKTDQPSRKEQTKPEPAREEPKEETGKAANSLPRIVTGISCADSTAFIFLSNGTFFHYNQKEQKVEEGYPKPVDNENWPGLGPYADKIVSSCIGLNDKFLFFLSDGTYVSYDIEKDRVEPGFPKPVGPKTMPKMEKYADQIKFSVSWAQDTAMFFLQDGTSLEYDLKKKKPVSPAPLPIDEKNRPGLGKNFDKVYAIIDWSENKFLAFLEDGTFIQYDVTENQADPGYPKPVDNTNLPGFADLVNPK